MIERALAIIGVGDVVRHRYARGLLATAERHPLEARWIFDVREPTEPLPPPLDRATFVGVPPSPEQAAAIVRRHVPPDHPVVIATPTPTHVPWALTLLPTHRTLAIEKPLCTTADELLAFDRALATHGGRWFPLAYYLLEKGLPLLALLAAEQRHPATLAQLSGPLGRLAETRRALGPVRRVEACILEGRGTAGTLTHRPWVLGRGGGGNTWDSLFHLTCLLAAATDLVGLEVTSTEAARVRHLGDDPTAAEGDTAHRCRLALRGGVEATLFAAKAVAPDSSERWMTIDFQRGRAHMDFESTTLRVEQPRGTIELRLRDRTPYATQLALLAGWLDDPAMALPLAIYRRALTAHRRIHAASAATPLRGYAAGSTPSRLFGGEGRQA